MPKVHFIQQDGTKTTIHARSGVSLLEIAHTNNISLEGACEGSLACATCHVVVDEQWFNKLPKAQEEEEDMLDLAFNLTKTSRLGCQIIMSPELDGLTVTLPSCSRNF